MSLANATSQDENATAAERMPPFLRLPVELRLKIYEYATDEPEWFTPDPKEAALLTLDAKNVLGRRPYDQGLVQQDHRSLPEVLPRDRQLQVLCERSTPHAVDDGRDESAHVEGFHPEDAVDFIRKHSQPVPGNEHAYGVWRSRCGS